ncbi:hypothetical protein B0H19DRAFT_1259114 [Mycena capillaripes]|nr:hypothetical protein B0H19DRAFT_1259114 [Mycena capillaripes]
MEDLKEDVLVRILGFSDIYSVICVNKYLRAIAFVKQLWISLVRDLIHRSLLELPPDFVVNQHSTTELIDLVKRNVTGPRTWVPTAEPSNTPASIVVVPANIKRIIGTKGDSKVKLVNGGRHIVIAHPTAVEIWDVATRRRLWTRPVKALNFGVDVGESATSINLVLMLWDRETMEIVQVDTRFGEALIFGVPLPCLSMLANPIISGRLVIVHMRSNVTREALIVDWIARTCVYLEGFRIASLPSLGIIGGSYLVVAVDDRYAPAPRPRSRTVRQLPTQIILYSIAGLDPYWRPLATLRTPAQERITLAALTPVLSETLQIEGHVFRNAQVSISVLESPLRHDTFKILVYAYDFRFQDSDPPYPQMSGTAAVFSYTCSAGGEHGWRQSSVRAALHNMMFGPGGLSYAGYVVDDHKNEIFNSTNVEIPVPDWNPSSHGHLVSKSSGTLWQDLSSYSSVVTRLMSTEVVIEYYA